MRFVLPRHRTDFPDHRKKPKLAIPPPMQSSSPSLLSPTSGNTKRKPKNRAIRRRAGKFNDPNRKAETYTSLVPTLDASDFGISKTGWQGKNPRGKKDMQAMVREWKDNSILIPLQGFVRIQYKGFVSPYPSTTCPSCISSLLTRLRDIQGRHFATRTFTSSKMLKETLPAFAAEADWLFENVERAGTGFPISHREANNRGSHWSSNFGHDRNYKSVSNFPASSSILLMTYLRNLL